MALRRLNAGKKKLTGTAKTKSRAEAKYQPGSFRFYLTVPLPLSPHVAVLALYATE
jgi:hypothetical protein